MSIELSRNILIGQYIPADTFVHRLDPRTKIVSTFLLLFAISFTRSLVACLIFLIVLLLLARLSQIPLGFVLRPFIRGLPFLFFFLLLSVLFIGWQEPTGAVLFEWRWVRITNNALLLAALSILRLVSILILVSLPTLTTRITELTHGVESLLHPFRRFGVPAQDIALVATISLRFVPILTEELERVIKAQASRGGAIGNLSWRQPVKVGKSLLPLIVPLFVNAFRRAEEMAVAMEARCYVRGAERTRMFRLTATWLDGVVVVSVIFFVSGVLLLTNSLSFP